MGPNLLPVKTVAWPGVGKRTGSVKQNLAQVQYRYITTYTYGTGTVQAQYRYGTGTVQVWYRYGAGMVQVQYRYRYSTGTRDHKRTPGLHAKHVPGRV